MTKIKANQSIYSLYCYPVVFHGKTSLVPLSQVKYIVSVSQMYVYPQEVKSSQVYVCYVNIFEKHLTGLFH